MIVTFEEALKIKGVWKSPEDLEQIRKTIKKTPKITRDFIRKFKNWPIDVYNGKVKYCDKWGNCKSFIMRNGIYYDIPEEI